MIIQASEGSKTGATEAKKSRSSPADEKNIEESAMDGIEEADVDIKELPEKVGT